MDQVKHFDSYGCFFVFISFGVFKSPFTFITLEIETDLKQLEGE